MSTHRVSLGGSLLAGALLVIGFGCSGSSPKPSGTGGATTDAGTGGAPSDGGSDVAKTDGGGGRDGGGTEVATGDTRPDTAGDAGSDGPTVCTTSYGAANSVLYAFNGGANAGWYHFLNDPPSSGLTTSLGASFTDGKSCPGALLLRTNFMAYGAPNLQAPSGSTEIFYGTSPNGRNWSTYKSLHAWIKVEATDYQQLAGVYFYVKSGGQAHYQDAAAMGAALSNGQFREMVVDLTAVPTGPGNGVVPNDVQLIGFQVLLNMAPPTGAPTTPSPVSLLVDDIWLEALPPSDAGSDAAASDAAASDAVADAPADAPAGG